MVSGAAPPRHPRLAPCVMVQGTASGVGKSVIVTALCRVLREEGWRVAPFKAQNMSLNAAVTRDGREIGRAQAAQADAAGIEARAEMNPILLKPEAEYRSQVVVMGRATGSVEASAYWGQRNRLWPVVKGALRTLRYEHDVVVIEGAGSPAEVNLRRHDLANMRVATASDASVLLVGDIERGGVLAQLVGTLELLRPRERATVRGLLVNKFRGDVRLFDGGVRFLRRATGLPVLGVLPFADDLSVPAEDSLSLDAVVPSGSIDVAVVRYPRISNFDDIEPLAEAGAAVRYVRRPDALGVPDLVVLPGSKSTISDLEWLRATGIAARLRALVDAGVPVVGICGGFQMLGEELRDPLGVEGPVEQVRGLGLLPVSTTFGREKWTVPVTGRVEEGSILGGSELRLEGYELHLGETKRGGAAPFATLTRGPSGEDVTDGAVSSDGLLVGTYVHGLFANRALRDALLQRLAARRGVRYEPHGVSGDRYAPLSAWFRSAVDLRALLHVVGLGERTTGGRSRRVTGTPHRG